MLKVFSDARHGEDLEADARRLHLEMLKKNDLPRLNGVTRAIVPTWCDSCGDRAWGPIKGFCICAKCRGEGKLSIGFR